jgi:AcrR family transcriptional regulator
VTGCPRQIAKDWGVALATATKVLNVLHQEGLVEAEPRVGTVVARPVTSPASPPRKVRSSGEPELTRERIVRAAVEIADAEGIDAVSMRGVAARLGVATMSPYRHVDSKDALILLMANAVYGEVPHPDPLPDGWRERIEVGGRALWDTHRRHPWLAQIFPLSRPPMLPNLMRLADLLLGSLAGLGFDAGEMLDLHILLYSHMQGLAAHLEAETRARAASGLTDEEWIEKQTPAMDAVAFSGQFPAFGRVHGALKTGYDFDLDHLYELGQRYILDGIAAESARRLSAGR